MEDSVADESNRLYATHLKGKCRVARQSNGRRCVLENVDLMRRFFEFRAANISRARFLKNDWVLGTKSVRQLTSEYVGRGSGEWCGEKWVGRRNRFEVDTAI